MQEHRQASPKTDGRALLRGDEVTIHRGSAGHAALVQFIRREASCTLASMNQRQKSQPRWTDVKAELKSFDRPALLDLIQNLYSAHKDNQTFLHARFGLGEDMLRPYKETIDRWLWPDAFSRQVPSVLKAKQAISNYKKAVGDSAGLADLMVFYCEQASGFASDLGYQDESYLNALVRMFDQALIIATTLPASGRDALVARLDRVRTIGHKCGYGVGDDMDSILAKHAKRSVRQSNRRGLLRH